MKKLAFAIMLMLGAAAQNLPAQTTAAAPEDPAHNELRALRDQLTAAVNKHDVEGMLRFLSPTCVFTPMDGTVSRGPEQIRAYLNRMLNGANAVVSDFSEELTVDQLADLYGGDTAVAWGSVHQTFKLRGGLQFESRDRWSATLVKENGQWLIADAHISANVFDNPVLSAAKKSAMITGIVAALVGLGLGLLIGKKCKRTAAPMPAAAG